MSTTAGRWMKLFNSLVTGDAMSLSRDARLLGVEAEMWSDDHETDGRIPRRALRTLTDADDPLDELTDALVEAGRWTETSTGWEIVGFLDRHDSAESRAVDKAANTKRQVGYGKHARGNHNPDGPKSCQRCEEARSRADVDGVIDTVNNGVIDHVIDRPARRRDATLSGKDRKARSAAAPASPPRAASRAKGTIFYDDRAEYERRWNELFDETGGDFMLCVACGDSVRDGGHPGWVFVEGDKFAHATCIAGDPRFVVEGAT